MLLQVFSGASLAVEQHLQSHGSGATLFEWGDTCDHMKLERHLRSHGSGATPGVKRRLEWWYLISYTRSKKQKVQGILVGSSNAALQHYMLP